jgi:anti-sigma-K factor RskA
MRDGEREAARLQTDLAQLRGALRAVEAPPVDEAELRGRFREATQRARAATLETNARGAWRVHVAAAAVVVLALGAVVAAVLLRVDAPMTTAVSSNAPQAEPVAISAFQPLSNSPRLSPASSYSVVRVRIPLSAFALIPGTEDSGSIEADLLVGEDGLARAIRFDETDASLVSVVRQ